MYPGDRVLIVEIDGLGHHCIAVNEEPAVKTSRTHPRQGWAHPGREDANAARLADLALLRPLVSGCRQYREQAVSPAPNYADYAARTVSQMFKGARTAGVPSSRRNDWPKAAGVRTSRIVAAHYERTGSGDRKSARRAWQGCPLAYLAATSVCKRRRTPSGNYYRPNLRCAGERQDATPGGAVWITSRRASRVPELNRLTLHWSWARAARQHPRRHDLR